MIDANIVVIGGGLMGSAAAWQLAKSGQKVHLIEQQGPVYSKGSSLGRSRIARSWGLNNNFWGFMHDQTVQEVKELISFLNQKESIRHRISDIYTSSPVNYVFFDSTTKLGGFEGVLHQQNEHCRYAFNPQQAKDLFGLTLPQAAKAWVREEKEYSGTLNPQDLMNKLHRAILLKGGKISYHSRVRKLSYAAPKYRIVLEQDKQTTILEPSKVLCAAGAYSTDLLAGIFPGLGQYIQPKRVYVAHFTFDSAVFKAWTKGQIETLFNLYPAIYFNDALSFAMFEQINEAGVPILKIGGHFCRNSYDSIDTVWSEVLSVSEIEWAKQETEAHLSAANLPIEGLYYQGGYSCVYSLTKNEVPFVCQLEDNERTILPGFVMMAGMSGVGAKGCMAYGRLAAALLKGPTAVYDADLARMRAFLKWRPNEKI